MVKQPWDPTNFKDIHYKIVNVTDCFTYKTFVI